jgi:GST-like protein
MTTAAKPLLLAAKGGGSAIVECLLTLAGIEYDTEYLDWDHLRDPQGRLMALNPLCEIPTLCLPDGQVLTESAAVTLWVGDQRPAAGLVPAAGDPHRAAFLRWLVWLVAAVYPTFTYGDHPERFVAGKAAGQQLRASTDARREEAWRQFEQAISPGPWLLGAPLTALDLYMAVMVTWRPRTAWFRTHCPKLHAVAARVAGIEALQPVWQRNEITPA